MEIILEPKSKRDLEALKAFASALKIPIKLSKSDSQNKANKQYFSELEESIEQAEQGKTTTFSMEEFSALCK